MFHKNEGIFLSSSYYFYKKAVVGGIAY